MSRVWMYKFVHETESCLMNCTSETVLITDVLSIKCARQHECSVHQGRHSRIANETGIRYFCSDPNELSAILYKIAAARISIRV